MIRCGNKTCDSFDTKRHATVTEVKACYDGRLVYGQLFATVADAQAYLDRETAEEMWAEGALVRSLETTEYPCYCGRGEGGICC